jgi:hypothetical protein
MGELSNLHLLIVDSMTPHTCTLRAALLREGAHVHVVSTPAAALMLARRKRIHTAFVVFSHDKAISALCAELAEMGIPQIFTFNGLVEKPVEATHRALREQRAFAPATHRFAVSY